jgi:hypothetical protein
MWESYFSLFIAGNVALALLSLVISRFTLYRHACKLLRDHPLWRTHKCRIIGMFDTIGVILSCTFPSYIDDSKYNGEFKISHYATRNEKLIAYVFITSMLLFYLCVIFYLLTKWFGIIDWSI